MKDQIAQLWSRLEHQFTAVFGPKRVHLEEKGLRLQFNLLHAQESEQFDRLRKELLILHVEHFIPAPKSKKPLEEKRAHGIILPPDVLDTAPTSDMEIFIPKTAAKDTLFDIANRMEIRPEYQPNGEVYRNVAEDEPAHVVEKLTGIKWRHVEHSPYDGSAILEPKTLSNVDGPLRAKQELLLANTLRPDGAASEVRDWLHIQTQVEQKRGMEPRTAIPEKWTDGLDGYESAGEPTGKVALLRKVFNPTR
jgi:hypothetical protein